MSACLNSSGHSLLENNSIVDLLRHASGRMTTHYSAPKLSQLLKCANLVCEKRPATVLRVIPSVSRSKLGQQEWGKRQEPGEAALTR